MLRHHGVEHVALLTGDQEPAARALAAAVGVDDVRAGLLPADKLAAVEAMLGTEPFTALFSRKITFSPVKESLTAFLASEAADTAAARAAILAAAEHTDVVTMTPITPKRKSTASGTPSALPVTRPQP